MAWYLIKLRDKFNFFIWRAPTHPFQLRFCDCSCAHNWLWY